jgi:hypothetical protein
MEELGTQLDTRRANPALKALVVEASQALARLDAAHLEELALSCQALNRSLGSLNALQRTDLAQQAREAEADMAVFGRVLEATRANLNVMNRLRELRLGRLDYGEPAAVAGRRHAHAEGDDGDY